MWRNWNLHALPEEIKTVQHWGKVWQYFNKLNKITIWPGNSTLGYVPKIL